MYNWMEFQGVEPKIMGKRKKFDNNIYSFDIETTSFIILKDGQILPALEYQNLSVEDQEECTKACTMYIWMFSINDTVYYGRTWDELKRFLFLLDETIPERKIVFIHNMGFEFSFMSSQFEMMEVLARKKRSPMRAKMCDYNIELRCSYYMTNCKLEKLPKLYNLPTKKLVGNLDYYKLRHSGTPLTKEELEYCENDCLVIYEYIKVELKQYPNVDKIPLTATGHVRRELKEITDRDYKYKNQVRKSINIDPHIYNLLIEAFAGGVTHANFLYANEVIRNMISYDFTSSYPYVMVAYKYPSTKFKKCNIKSSEEMLKRFAYLLVVRFKNISSKFFNNFLSASKCRYIKGAKYDNGRIVEAKEVEIVLTDIDFKILLESYKGTYKIVEAYYSFYDYLPKKFIDFILEKYTNKTQYKNVEGKELEYAIEKGKFNSLYGMSVTNTIRDEVIYYPAKGWDERKLENGEILDMLAQEEKKGFLSFSYGVWVTAYARKNLLSNIMKLDKYTVYCDTDSIKLREGFDMNVITDYNKSVEKRIRKVSKELDIPYEKFAPKDVKGEAHLLGVFDNDGVYEEFITQGAKKYCDTRWVKNEKLKGNEEIIKRESDRSLIIEITVAGVPKPGVKSLHKDINNFKDDLVFDFKDTNKLMIQYVENQDPIEMIDYLGNKYKIDDKSGACLLPTTYILGKALDYCNLLDDNSSARSIYYEEVN